MSEKRREFAEALDGQLPTPVQLQQLSQLSAEAFLEIRSHARDPDFVFALADAFHCLPSVMFAAKFKWSWFLIHLNGLGHKHPETRDRYLAEFDKIVGFQHSD